MKFRPNTNMYNVLFATAVSLWLCGSKGADSGFEIYRSDQDVFKNLNCYGRTNCTKYDCQEYGGECYRDDHCQHCRCSQDKRTFMIDKYNPMQGRCISDENVVAESVPNERFWLRNENRSKCLIVDGDRAFGADCSSPPTLDMLWIWIGTNKTQLMNIKTRQCLTRNNRNVSMSSCVQLVTNEQNIICTNDSKLKWTTERCCSNLYLFLRNRRNRFAAGLSRIRFDQWTSNETQRLLCGTKKDHKGCYRLSDGSFIKYLNYSETNFKVEISAPIFKENINCTVQNGVEFIQDGHEWKTTETFPSIQFKNKWLQTSDRPEKFKAWNGSLIKLYVNCGGEKHCVLLKLESLPNYTQVINRTLLPSSSSTSPNKKETPTKSNEGRTSSGKGYGQPTDIGQENRKETSGSDSSNSTVIAVTVTFLVLAIILAVWFLLYYKKRKRVQAPENSTYENGITNYSKDIYEDPDRIYETLKDDGNAVSHNQAGTSFNSCNHPDDNVTTQTLDEQEYTYAQVSDLDKTNSNSDPESHAVYNVLEQPEEQAAGDKLYGSPGNIVSTNPTSTELEYTYAKDTEIPRRSSKDQKPGTKEDSTSATTDEALYHTLEHEESPSTEEEYSYAKNTDVPSIPSATEQMDNTDPLFSPSSDLYHTLEPNPPDIDPHVHDNA